MARLGLPYFVQGGIYHVYNRGNRKQNLFLNSKDYQRYLERLEKYKEKHHISILAYCLMPNHVHLLLRQNGPEPISIFIQKLHTAYSMYFNKKYGQVGHVFQNRFKAKIVSRDEYLLHVSRYIHLNPKKLVKKLPVYPWNSYKAYIGAKKDSIVDTDFILSMFKKNNKQNQNLYDSYKNFVKEYGENFDTINHLIFDDD